MDHQNKPQVAYPPPSTAYPATTRVPPPMGYPMKDVQANSQNDASPGKTRARGDGFWKGCCAALCCCCVLDACF
ncbi:Protein mms22 like [Actinidia chinensis var. chinensis]|uniref:Protein mms22 like n=1 Tax=Actinidia chinensis var. chinensis TaxID=1590841 RepID=A0A2R6QC25_ACTCC|nr:Protein mms22 like [Actinidia chinensis var. chinensis]